MIDNACCPPLPAGWEARPAGCWGEEEKSHSSLAALRTYWIAKQSIRPIESPAHIGHSQNMAFAPLDPCCGPYQAEEENEDFRTNFNLSYLFPELPASLLMQRPFTKPLCIFMQFRRRCNSRSLIFPSWKKVAVDYVQFAPNRR